MLKFAIYPNFQKKNALSCAVEVCKRLYAMHGSIYADQSCTSVFAECPEIQYGDFSALLHQVDIVIAIGGDGTMLRCARQMIGSSACLLGINTGHLGFMAGLETNQLDELKKLFQGKYYRSERILLQGALHTQTEHFTFTALNDIAISGLCGKIFDFSVYADNTLIGRYRADGIICSTPTGSTAYALSAGGPLMEPELSCIEITLLCPHSLFNRPLLLSSDRKITIRHTADSARHVCLSADGETPLDFPCEAVLEIRKSQDSIALIHMTDSSFFDSVNKKLMQSIKGMPEIE